MLFKIIIFSLFISYVSGQVDQTLVAGQRGQIVVDAVLEKIESHCIFNKNYLFLRRLAWIQTQNGLNQGQSNGGIWKVTLDQFIESKKASPLTLNKISSLFKINWKSVTYQDLEKPFFSGLAIHLYFQFKGYNFPFSLQNQANFWVSWMKPSSPSSFFVNEITSVEKKCVSGAVDLALVFDGSGSIGEQNFIKMKNFAKDLIDNFNVGSNYSYDSRVALIQFSNYVSMEFNFKSFSTKRDYKNAIDRIYYKSGGTKTHEALKFLIDSTYKSSLGAREGVPKIAIVITDGASNRPFKTLRQARRLQATDIETFAVGVGFGVINKELESIATDPDCKHLYHLNTFQEFESLFNSIRQKLCNPTSVINKNTTINLAENQTRTLQFEDGICLIEFYNKLGAVKVYYGINYTPNPAFNDGNFDLAQGETKVIKFNRTSSEDILRVFIQAETLSSIDISLNADCSHPCDSKVCGVGEHCEEGPGFTGICVKDCPHCIITTNFDCTNKNPCTKRNADLGLFYFPHHTFNHFVQCSEWGQCYIMPCPSGLFWDQTILTCNRVPTEEEVIDKPVLEEPKSYTCDDPNPCTPENSRQNKFYFPHKTRDHFTQCSEWGQCYVMPCAPGTIWSQNYLTCVHDTGFNPESNPKSTPGFNLDSTLSSNHGSDPGFNCEDLNPCTSENSALKKFYFTHTTSDHFVQCSEWGQCFVMPCPPGLFWNQNILNCASRDTGSGNPYSTPSGPIWITNSKGFSTTPLPFQTSHSFNNGISNKPSYPVENGYDCIEKNPCNSENSSQNKFYFPYITSDRFVQCSQWGQCFVMPCPLRTRWDQEVLTCNHGTVSLFGGQSDNDVNPPIPPTPGYGSYSCGFGNPCTPENAALKKFYFPHRSSNQFVQCSEWGQCYEMPCPSGLVWNQRFLTCYFTAK